MDPPYLMATRADNRRGHGYRHELDEKDHERLVEFLAGLKGSVILSGYEHPLYDRLGWVKETHSARVLSTGGSQVHRTEAVWMNAAAIAARPQAGLFEEGAG